MRNNGKRDVLFLCQYFYPENNSSATLPFDTACALASAGLRVSALCGMPHEYAEETRVPARETVSGVEIHRVGYFHPPRGSRVGRLLNFFSFTLSVLLHLRELKRHRAVIVYSNPPVLPLVAWIAEKLFGTKLIFVAYDLYPEIALASNSIRPGGCIDRVMRWINRRVFRRASAVVALSGEMRDTVLRLRREIAGDRVHVLPNWAHEAAPTPKRAEDEVLTVGYIGNLGVAQEVETLLDAVERLKNDSRFRFLFAGHGSKLETVRMRTAENKQVHVDGFLTGDDLERVLRMCDCCVVSLNEGLHGLCMPSKYYSYLQAGTAIMSIMEPDAELSREVVSERIGIAVAPGDTNGLCAALISMAEDLPAVREAGMRAAALYRERYARGKALSRYVELIRNVLEEP